jgi:hypothetical protein
MLTQLGAYFDRFSLDEITQDRAREWRTWRLKNVVASTICREQEVLLCVLNAAVPTYLERNVLHGLDCSTPSSTTCASSATTKRTACSPRPTPADSALIFDWTGGRSTGSSAASSTRRWRKSQAARCARSVSSLLPAPATTEYRYGLVSLCPTITCIL